ncbi:FUN34 transmembrane protein, partial [Mycena galopus ATCC 62051]
MTEQSEDSEKGIVCTRDHVDDQPVIATPEGPAHKSIIASPGALALFSHASTTFVLSMCNLHVRGITQPNIVVGMAIFVGGLTQFMAGMWEYPRGNVFGATAFSSTGAFWMSYAAVYVPGSGTLAAYTDPEELNQAVGIYLLTWVIVTLFFLMAVFRQNATYMSILATMASAFLFFSIGLMSGNLQIVRAGAIFGVTASCITFYGGLSELLGADEDAVVHLPQGHGNSNKHLCNEDC